MTLNEILQSADITAPGSFAVSLSQSWMQGRTAYGGVSSALAFIAAQSVEAGLPPLRSAQISFIGPLAGTLTITARLLRRGRTAAFVRSDVSGEAGLGLSGVFAFMEARPSSIDHMTLPTPALLPAEMPVRAPVAPRAFFQNFDYVDAGSDAPGVITRWVRLKDARGLDPIAALVALADALPPAALPLAKQAGPISSMTWMINMLTDRPETRDGWWLLRSATNYTRNGCSSQDMAIWNADGVPVATGMQSVALFV